MPNDSVQHQPVPDIRDGSRHPACVKCEQPLAFTGEVWEHRDSVPIQYATLLTGRGRGCTIQ